MIVMIDLSKVTQMIIDISNHTTAPIFFNHPQAINFAVKHQEVLIQGGVNIEAFIGAIEG
jgi:hypothetical protein